MAVRSRPKEFCFPVEVTWDGGRRTTASIPGKPPVRIAPPPEFRGTDPGVWSPEDALVMAAASCLAVTIAGAAERDHVPLQGLTIGAQGVVGRRSDGRFGFIRIEQRLELTTDAEHEAAARALVDRAEDGCLVAVSLDLPVVTSVTVRTAVPSP